MGEFVMTILNMFALLATLGCFISNLIAFATPYWVETIPRPRRIFERLGLWTACFHYYKQHQSSESYYLTGCHWVYSDYYKNSRDWLLPDWFIGVQVLSAAVFAMLLIATVLFIMYFARFVRRNDTAKTDSCVLTITAVLLLMSGLLETVVVIVFRVKRDDHRWLPLNKVSWSYWLAFSSAVGAFAAGAIVMVAALLERRARAKQTRRHGEREYAMSDSRREALLITKTTISDSC